MEYDFRHSWIQGLNQCQPCSVSLSVAHLTSPYAMALFSGTFSALAREMTKDNLKLSSLQLGLKRRRNFLSPSQYPYYTFCGEGHKAKSKQCTHHYPGKKNSHFPTWSICSPWLTDWPRLCSWRVLSREGTLTNTCPLSPTGGVATHVQRTVSAEKWTKGKWTKASYYRSVRSTTSWVRIAPKCIAFHNTWTLGCLTVTLYLPLFFSHQSPPSSLAYQALSLCSLAPCPACRRHCIMSTGVNRSWWVKVLICIPT